MLIFYVVFFFLIIRFSITLFNFISNPKLPTSPIKHTDFVSLLIQVKNGERNIKELLESIQLQDYKDFEVLILDKGSTDQTRLICKSFSDTDARFQLLNQEVLEDGWLEENFACHQLAKAAKGKYLIFIKPGVLLENTLITDSIHRIKQSKLAVLSVFSTHSMVSTSERLVTPLMYFLLLSSLPLRLVRLSGNSLLAASSDDFIIYDASNYSNHQWHSQVKDNILAAFEIMKLIKSYQYNAEVLLSNGQLKSNTSTPYLHLVRNYSRIFLPAFQNNIAGLICYLLLVIVGNIFIAIYLNSALLLFAIGLIILIRIMISLLTAQNVLYNIILHPLQMITLVIVSYYCIRNYIKNHSLSEQDKYEI